MERPWQTKRHILFISLFRKWRFILKKQVISLVSGRQTTDALIANLTRDLRLVFGDTVKIEIIAITDLKAEEQVLGDVILATYPGIVRQLKDHVSDMNKVIIVTRTVTEEMIYQLYDFPQGTNVLVVNDTRETTEDTVSMLYQLGIRHLNLLPYYPGETDLSGIHIAVTPGEAHLVPSTISMIVDIGDRRLDMQTFLDIFTLLNVSSDSVKQSLIRYANTTLELHAGVKTRYIRDYKLGESLKQILNLQKTGIIVTDNHFTTNFWNTAVERIVTNRLEEGLELNGLFSESTGKRLTGSGFDSELMAVNHQQYLVTRTPIFTMEQITGYYYEFESAIQIRKTGNTLSQNWKRQGLFAKYTFDDIIHQSPLMEQSIALAKKAAASDVTILFTGESGTGKEMFAQSVHNASKRRSKPFVAVNCAALPENLLESELFGYEEGAFTGARRGGKVGLFERADGGTIFLDEIGDVPYPLQVKLLRVLQEQQVVRLGGENVINIDVRVLAATNADLKELIREKKFREDLYYRLNVVPVKLPPLRKRKEDILPLFSSMSRIPADDLPEDVRLRLMTCSWPGNVRELHNAAEYYSLIGTLDCLEDTEPDKEKQVVLSGAPNHAHGIREEILSIIKARADNGKNTGRESLKEELAQRGIEIGYTRMEKVLNSMCAEKILIRKKGPGGIQIL